jgi:hypothetical protein
MSISPRSLRKLMFGIAPDEVRCARRGFHRVEGDVRQRLEYIGTTFLHGYHLALEVNEPNGLGERLEGVPLEWRGFAFEGAAMSLALQDHLLPWRSHRWQAFLDGPGAPHTYMVHVGFGWALARVPWRRFRFERSLGGLDPLLCWLAVEGFGFHEGYFYWPQSIGRQAVPRHLSSYGRRVFDQGLGRSLWFVDGADVARIPRTIAGFPSSRRADLWSGVGLGCAYAGGRERAALEALSEASGPFHPHLAQGAAFAAKARQRAGNPAAHTELACAILCGLSAEEAAALTDQTLAELPAGGPEPAFEIWRCRLQAYFRGATATWAASPTGAHS